MQHVANNPDKVNGTAVINNPDKVNGTAVMFSD
jgi:hypothetical protein